MSNNSQETENRQNDSELSDLPVNPKIGIFTHDDYSQLLDDQYPDVSLPTIVTEQLCNPSAALEAIRGHKGTICKVCSKNPASIHRRFGAVACHSCGEFFRRAQMGNKYQTFRCSRYQECFGTVRSGAINLACKWCRYQSCLQAGMLPLFRKRPAAAVCPVKLYHKPNDWFTTMEFSSLESEEAFIKSYCSYHQLNDLATQEWFRTEHLSAMFDRTALSYNAWRMTEECNKVLFRDSPLKRQQMASLTKSDMNRLVEENSSITFNFLGTRQKALKTSTSSEAWKSMMLNNASKYFKINKAIESFIKQMNQCRSFRNFQTVHSLTYDQLYISPWAKSIDLEIQHRELVREIHRQYISLRELFNDTKGFFWFLFNNVMFFSSDDPQKYNSPQKIIQLQRQHMDRLYRYLKLTCDTEQAMLVLYSTMSIHKLACQAVKISKTERLGV